MRVNPTSPDPASERPALPPAWFAGILALCVAIEFGAVLAGWRSFFTRDFLSFGYPLACHLRESLLAGEWPLWNGSLLLGVPHLAQWNTMTLYPPMLLAALLPMPWGLNVFNVGHLVLGAFGMRRLVRLDARDSSHSDLAGAAAGICYALGGLMLTALMWPNNVAALGWAPWVIASLLRAASEGGRSVCWAALLTALQWLAGAPEAAGLTALLGTTAAVSRALESGVRFRVIAVRGASVLFLAVALTAAQWVPFLELLLRSHRDTGFGGEEWSLGWAGLANLIVPWFQTTADRDGVRYQAAQHWLTSPYAGIWMTAFALLASRFVRSRWIVHVLACSLLLAWLSLGGEGRLLPWLKSMFPWLGLMRYPVKFLMPLLIALPWIGGLGMNGWLATPSSEKPARRFSFIVLGLMLAVGGLGLGGWLGAASTANGRAELLSAATRLLMLALGWFAFRRLSNPVPSTHRWLMPSVIVLMMAGDLIEANRHIYPTVPAGLMQPSPSTPGAARSVNAPLLDPKPELGKGRARVASSGHARLDRELFLTPEAAVQIPRLALLLNMNLLEGIPKLDGFLSLYLPRTLQVVRRLEETPTEDRQRLLDFLGVSHESRSRTPWVWDSRPRAGSWASWVSEARFEPDTASLDTVFSRDFDPASVVLLPPEARLETTPPIAREGKRPDVRLTSQGHNGWIVEVEADRDGYVVLAQSHDPGWRAWLDGEPIPVLRANHAFQAFRVPAGKHRITLHYAPWSFRIGAGVSAAAFLGGLALIRKPRTSRA